MNIETPAPTRYRCTKCGHETSADLLQPSVSSRHMIGHCRECRTIRLFREPTGEELKSEGIATVHAAVAADGARPDGDAAWRLAAERAIRALAAERVRFTANDVTERVGLPSRRNLTGAIMNTMARQGVIRKVGFRSGGRASQHARVVAEWEGA